MYSSQGSGNYAGSTGYTAAYAPLENIVASYILSDSVEREKREVIVLDRPAYSLKNADSGLLTPNYARKYHFEPESFLLPNRPLTQFVAGFDQALRQHMEAAFKATTGKEFPTNITIAICDRETLKAVHDKFGWWNEGIQGFSLNRHGTGVSEIFVRAGELDEVMLTIGHELGHVLSPKLASSRDEEAKAFAFSLAWMEAIVENNIAGLKHSINPMPANNGVHDVAFAFVRELMNKGNDAGKAFIELAAGRQSLERQVELIVR